MGLGALAAAVESGRGFRDGDLEGGVFFAGVAVFAGWVIWRSWRNRRGRAATLTDALVVAGMFLFIGAFSLASAIADGPVGAVLGGLSAAILLPAAFLILRGAWRSGRQPSTE